MNNLTAPGFDAGKAILLSPALSQASEIVKRFSFNVSDEGWSFQTTKVIGTFRRDGYDSPNDPATGDGVLQLRLYGASLTEGATVPILVYNDVPWSSLGIPAQSKIAAVKGAYDWRCLTYSSMAGAPENHSGIMALYDASGEPVVQMVSGIPITATSTWATNQGGFVGAGDISASETLRLRIAPLLATGTGSSSVILTLHDWIQLFVRYYVPYLSAAQVLGLRPTLEAPSLSVPQASDFEAEGIDSGAVILGMPAVSQTHVITASSIINGNPVLPAPVVQQYHTLTIPGVVSGPPVLPAPQLHESNRLSVSGILSQNPVLSVPSLAQRHVFAGMGIVTEPPVLPEPVLRIPLVYVLAAMGILASAPEPGNPILDVYEQFRETFRRSSRLHTQLNGVSALVTSMKGPSLFTTKITGRSVLR